MIDALYNYRQCKFYDVNNSVSKDDVDTFISASGQTSDNIDSITDLVIPATTDVNKLIARYVGEDSDNTLNFFFSTYQSIEVVR